MNDLVSTIIRQALGRQETAEDYHRVNEMLAVLPSEMRASPAVITEIVLRMEFLRSLEETVRQASWEAQQKIHKDLPARIDQAALSALNRIRDHMPVDAKDAARRMYRLAVISLFVTASMFGGSGWIAGANYARAKLDPGHAWSDQELARCVDAAAGAFSNSARNGVRSAPGSADTVRDDLMKCGAEYADRRSGST